MISLLKISPFDFDRDGREDLMILGSRTSRVYLKPDSSLNDDYFAVGTVSYGYLNSALPFDYNRDGIMDILSINHLIGFAGYQTVFQAFEQSEITGMRLWRDTHWFDLPRGFYDVGQFKARLADINQNGKMDFVATIGGPFPNYYSFWAFENPDPSFQTNLGGTLSTHRTIFFGIIRNEGYHLLRSRFC